MRNGEKKKLLSAWKIDIFLCQIEKEKEPILLQWWQVFFLCSLSHKYTHPACNACLWWGVCRCNITKILLCPRCKHWCFTISQKPSSRSSLCLQPVWRRNLQSLKLVRNMPLQSQAVWAVIGTFRLMTSVEQISSRPLCVLCLGRSYPMAGFLGGSAQMTDPLFNGSVKWSPDPSQLNYSVIAGKQVF